MPVPYGVISTSTGPVDPEAPTEVVEVVEEVVEVVEELPAEEAE